MEEGIGGNLLDPAALEFYPVSQFGPIPAQIYYPYPPPPLPPPPPPPLPPAAAYHRRLQHYALPDDGEPTRAVMLSLLPRHIDEAAVTAAMEAFGAVRAIESAEHAAEGASTVHFYDLRSALAAVFEIREQHMRQQSFLSRQYGVVPANWGLADWPPVADPAGRGLVAGHAVWAQFSARGPDGPNQGSLFVLNCDPAVPLSYLAELFGAIGHVKEVREIPWKPPQRFVEFFDIRDAARALAELNGREVYGRRLVLEFTSSMAGHSKRRSGGQHRGFTQPPRLQRPQPGRWVEVQLPSSSSRGANRKAEGVVGMKMDVAGRKVAKNHNAGSSGSGAGEDKRGKASRQPSAGGASSSSSSSSSTAAKQQQLSRRGWKNHPRNGGDARFQFKEEMATEGSSICNDSRTTVMIKNIPNKYSQKLLLRMLDNHCIRCNEEIGNRGDGDDQERPLSAYDFVYLPIDFNNKCNVGYGFVNLTSPEAAVRLYKAFHMQPWEVFNSRKICQVNYARLQGLEALKEHFKNSKFACDTDEYMPVMFYPPRDGKRLTEPVPVGGRGGGSGLARRNRGGGADDAEARHEDAGGASSTTASTHAPSDNADGADDDDDDGRGGSCSCGSDETASRLSQALLQLSTYSSQG